VLERPQPVTAASDYAALHPTTIASPPRARGGYANAVEELRANHPAHVALAESGGEPAPELFPGWGNGPPPDTVSGLSASMFSGLPWRARLAGCYEPNRARAFELAMRYAEPDGEQAAWDEFHAKGIVGEAEQRALHWFGTSGLGDNVGLAASAGGSEALDAEVGPGGPRR
jgi:hypothetical protein